MLVSELIKYLRQIKKEKGDCNVDLSVSGDNGKYPFLRFYVSEIDQFSEVMESNEENTFHILVLGYSNEDYEEDVEEETKITEILHDLFFARATMVTKKEGGDEWIISKKDWNNIIDKINIYYKD